MLRRFDAYFLLYGRVQFPVVFFHTNTVNYWERCSNCLSVCFHGVRNDGVAGSILRRCWASAPCTSFTSTSASNKWQVHRYIRLAAIPVAQPVRLYDRREVAGGWSCHTFGCYPFQVRRKHHVVYVCMCGPGQYLKGIYVWPWPDISVCLHMAPAALAALVATLLVPMLTHAMLTPVGPMQPLQPLFLYLPFQAVHAPAQVTQCITNYKSNRCSIRIRDVFCYRTPAPWVLDPDGPNQNTSRIQIMLYRSPNHMSCT